MSYETSQDLKNILGHLAYVLEGAKRLLDIKSYHMKVVTESGVIEDNFIYGMVTNSRSVGGFKNLTKDVDMNDGLFEVTLIVQPKNPLEMQEIIRDVMSTYDEDLPEFAGGTGARYSRYFHHLPALPLRPRGWYPAG